MNATTQARVAAEIEDLHAFFVEWFGGTAPDDDAYFQARFTDRFVSDFEITPPAGVTLTGSRIGEIIRADHGTNPEFRIVIRNVHIRREIASFVLVTYEEWQRNALNSTPPDNARRATVLLELGDRIRWHHLQETWLPADVVAAGPWDF